MSLCVIVPSRGRPENVRQLIESCSATCRQPDTHIVVAVDDDDEQLPHYEAVCARRDAVTMHVGPPLGMNGTLNLVANYEAERFTHLGFMGDDHRPRTVGWDKEMFAATGGLGVTYGNDLIHGPALPTAVVLHGEIVRRLGYMAPPVLKHMYLDNFWKRIGTELGTLTYLDDVVIEHLHPLVGTAGMDENYERVAAMIDSDRVAYDEYLANGLAQDLEKLRG